MLVHYTYFDVGPLLKFLSFRHGQIFDSYVFSFLPIRWPTIHNHKICFFVLVMIFFPILTPHKINPLETTNVRKKVCLVITYNYTFFFKEFFYILCFILIFFFFFGDVFDYYISVIFFSNYLSCAPRFQSHGNIIWNIKKKIYLLQYIELRM